MTIKSHKKPFEPMLAAPRGVMRFPCIVQPKYDGIRCVVRNGVALTRMFEPIPNRLISATLSNPAFDGLDGELIDGPHDKDVYHRTESVVMSADGDPSNTVFNVFDDFTDPTAAYSLRFSKAISRCVHAASSVVRTVPSYWAHTEESLMDHENAAHEQGFEGAIVRDPQALYKYGRATENEGSLWKMKRFVDEEMTVFAVEERNRNENEDVRSATGKAKRGHSKAGKVGTGLLGVLVGTSPNYPGAHIRVGSSNLPRIPIEEAYAMFVGNDVTFKHQPAGAKDLPRFPIYKCIRHPAI